MIRITDAMEQQIRAAMHELEVAGMAQRERYAERLIGKLEMALELGSQIGENYKESIREIILGESKPETRPMNEEDINNVEVIVKKKADRKIKKDNTIPEVKKLMKAGKNLKEIAEETGRKREEVQSDIRFVEGQEAK